MVTMERNAAVLLVSNQAPGRRRAPGCLLRGNLPEYAMPEDPL